MKPPSSPGDRIAVTGAGIVSALGFGAVRTFERLMAGERGFLPIRLFDPKDARCRIAAAVSELDVHAVAPRGEQSAWSRTDALALVAAREALTQARFGGGRLAIAHAGTAGAMLETEREVLSGASGALERRARRFVTDPLCRTTERLSRVLGASALTTTVCAACASSAVAIVRGMDWIRRGAADAVLAGGADGLCALTFFGFGALGALDPEPCRPFDVARRGLSLGEAGAFLLLELESRARERGAKVLALLSGAATGAEAHHMTHPEPSGERAAELIESALRSAHLTARDVDYVNAHGTGTLPNDRMEALALARSLGDARGNVYVSSSKGQLGHTLGAAGALEAALTVLALERGEVPPTAGLERPEDPSLRHVPGAGIHAPLRAALSCSFGFGGTGCVLLLESAGAPVREIASRVSRVVVTGIAVRDALGELSGSSARAYLDPPPSTAIPPSPEPLGLLDPARSRRFDANAALVTRMAELALGDAGLEAEKAGLVSGNALGSVERSLRFVERVGERGLRGASPADFPHLVASAAPGNASIYLGLRGPVLAVSEREAVAESALATAVGLIGAGQSGAFVAGGAVAFDPVVAAVRRGGSDAREEGDRAALLVIEAEELARERGATLRARLDGPLSIGPGESLSAAKLGPPRDPGRALLVTSVLAPEHARLLDESAWGRCLRRSSLLTEGGSEMAGGLALAGAAAWVAAGLVDEALVAGSSGEVLYLTRFCHPELEA